MYGTARFSGLRNATSLRDRVIKFSTGGANTFYDSQSGGFITKPGSGGVRIHDNQFKHMNMGGAISNKDIVDYIREASRFDKVASVSLPHIPSDDAFDRYMNISVPYLIRNRQKLRVKVVSQLRSDIQLSILHSVLMRNAEAKEVLETEIDILVRKDLKLGSSDASSNSSGLVAASVDLAKQGLATRVNLYFNIDPFINRNEAEILSVIEVGEIFASLCDVGVKVINICLCSSSATNAETLSPSTTEAVLDYLREIIEEGLNLDVSGDALLERLSVQCFSERVVPGVVELAVSLGITRFVSGGVSSGAGEGGVVINGSDKLSVLDTMPLVDVSKLLK